MVNDSSIPNTPETTLKSTVNNTNDTKFDRTSDSYYCNKILDAKLYEDMKKKLKFL